MSLKKGGGGVRVMEIPGTCGVNSVMVDARERWDGNVYVDGCDNGGKF